MMVRPAPGGARGHLARSLAALLGSAILLLPLQGNGSAEPERIGELVRAEGVVSIVTSVGAAVQPAQVGTPLGGGSRIATVGPGGAVLALGAGCSIELGGRTTVMLESTGDDSGRRITLLAGAMLARSSNIGCDLTLTASWFTLELPDHGAGEIVFGVAISDEGAIVAVCGRCPADGLRFGGKDSVLFSGKARAYSPRGEATEWTLRSALFTELAEFPDDNSGRDPRPPGQRTSVYRPPSSDRERPSSTPTLTPTSTSTPITQGTPEPSATSLPTASPTVTQTPVTVNATIANFVYLPDPVVVPVGGSVRWVNLDVIDHTVTADDRSWTSPVMFQNDVYTRTFTQAGTYRYFCEPHPFMIAEVLVQ